MSIFEFLEKLSQEKMKESAYTSKELFFGIFTEIQEFPYIV